MSFAGSAYDMMQRNKQNLAMRRKLPIFKNGYLPVSKIQKGQFVFRQATPAELKANRLRRQCWLRKRRRWYGMVGILCLIFAALVAWKMLALFA